MSIERAGEEAVPRKTSDEKRPMGRKIHADSSIAREKKTRLSPKTSRIVKSAKLAGECTGDETGDWYRRIRDDESDSRRLEVWSIAISK